MARRSKASRFAPEVAASEDSPPIQVGSSGKVMVEFDRPCTHAGKDRVKGERIEVDHYASERIIHFGTGHIIKD